MYIRNFYAILFEIVVYFGTHYSLSIGKVLLDE